MKKIKENVGGSVGWGEAYLITENKISHAEGRILTFIEALGLPDKQERSLKSIIRTEIWDILLEALWVPDAIHNELRERQGPNGTGIVVSPGVPTSN